MKSYGVHLKPNKYTENMAPNILPLPETVKIMAKQHIGAIGKAVVGKGERVKVGTLLFSAGEGISSPIYSSVSGRVKQIFDIPIFDGGASECIEIENDFLLEKEKLQPPKINSYGDFISAVKASGVVGLGGAGFPTFAKLDVGEDNNIDTLIVNCAECEPYITSDSMTARDKLDFVFYSLELIGKYLKPQKTVFAYERRNREAVARVKNKIAKSKEKYGLFLLPNSYPQGSEKTLIYSVTKRIVAEGQLPRDVGVIVVNISTLAALSEYILTGRPLTEKCITVDGSGVRNHQNVICPIGTSVCDILAFCSGTDKISKVIMGGPMMGIALPYFDYPITKQTNAILAFEEGPEKKTTQCIRCGSCLYACPVRLSPVMISRAVDTNNIESLDALKVNLCVECGCCEYVCPSARPLVVKNRVGKKLLWENKENK